MSIATAEDASKALEYKLMIAEHIFNSTEGSVTDKLKAVLTATDKLVVSIRPDITMRSKLESQQLIDSDAESQDFRRFIEERDRCLGRPPKHGQS